MTIEIIAEIAQGYEGSPKLSELLVEGALVADADAVKIQIIYADELCVPDYPYYGLFKSLEMEKSVWQGLVSKVKDAKKKIYFDVYGDRSINLAKELKVDGVKISTTDFYNFPLLKQAFTSFDNVFVSTGGVPKEDIDEMVNMSYVPSNLVLMHGFQDEPTKIENNNLARITTLLKRYPDVGIGFMDHSLGSEEEAFNLPLIALGMGIKCIEKHITLDYSLQIEDYISALSVDRFKKFVSMIRQMEPSLGSSELTLTPEEIDYKNRAGKVVVAVRNLKEGECITEEDIAMKRVSTSPSDEYYQQAAPLIGKSMLGSLKIDEPFIKKIIK